MTDLFDLTGNVFPVVYLQKNLKEKPLSSSLRRISTPHKPVAS